MAINRRERGEGHAIGAVYGDLLQSRGSTETHTQEKCLKDVQEATPRADPWGLLGDPHSGNEDKKDARIGSANKKRNSLASERSHIKHAEQYQVPRGMDNSRKETRR